MQRFQADADTDRHIRMMGEASKRFFFEKKNQKTFFNSGPEGYERPSPNLKKFFCYFFFKKSSASFDV